MTKTGNKKKLLLRIAVLAVTLSVLLGVFMSGGAGSVAAAQSVVELFDGVIDTNRDSFFNGAVVQKLPDTVKPTDQISLIVQVKEDSILDTYDGGKKNVSLAEFAASSEATDIRTRVRAKKAALLEDLDAKGIAYEQGADYATLLCGFELVITASDFESVVKALGKRATAFVSEVYNRAETQLVENDVNVYDTGIFNSSGVPYDGTGMVVAVLDTGLDYNHSAFSTKNFTADRSKLATWSANARNYYLKNYTKGLCIDNLISIISNTSDR